MGTPGIPVTRAEHLAAVKEQALSRLDASPGDLQDVLDYLAAGMRAHPETDSRLMMVLLTTEGVRCIDEYDVTGMRKLIGFLCGPPPQTDL